LTVSRRTQAQVAEVNASSITSGSISVVAGDAIIAWVFTDGGTAVSCSDSSGATGFWDLFKDGSSGQKVYVKQRTATTTSLTVTYTNSQVAHLSMAVLVYSGVIQVLRKPDPPLNDLDIAAINAGLFENSFYLGWRNGYPTTGLIPSNNFSTSGYGDSVLVMTCSHINGSAAPIPTGSGQTSLYNQNGFVKWDIDTSGPIFSASWNTTVASSSCQSGILELLSRDIRL
jgi:hypothetical protein